METFVIMDFYRYVLKSNKKVLNNSAGKNFARISLPIFFVHGKSSFINKKVDYVA